MAETSSSASVPKETAAVADAPPSSYPSPELEQQQTGGLPYSHERLLRAVRENNPTLIHAILDSGIDVNGSDPSTGYTALHAAAEAGFTALCKLLIDRGADSQKKNNAGLTALDLVILKRCAADQGQLSPYLFLVHHLPSG